MLTIAEKRELLALEEERSRRAKRRRLFSYTPYPKQLEFHQKGATDRERLLMAANQVGKELKFDEPILTPRGWVEIQNLRVGDRVIAGDGSVTTVTGFFPQGIKPMVEIEFCYGTKIVAGHEHLWKVMKPKDRFKTKCLSLPRINGKKRRSVQVENTTHGQWSVLDTQTMRAAYGDNPAPVSRFAVPAIDCAKLDSQRVPVDPYVLGMILGDGCTKYSSVGLTTSDPEMAEAFRVEAEAFGCRMTNPRRFQYFASTKTHGNNSLKNSLEYLGIMGKGASDKRVPEQYLWNEPAVRLAILQGLMDTDGTCEKSGITTFTSISQGLAEDVQFLARSFGAKCYITSRIPTYTHKGEKRLGQRAYTVVIRLPHAPLFRLKRKLDRYKRPVSTSDHHIVVSFRDVEPAEAYCISVSHPDRTYVTRDFVVTHNTWSAGFECAMHLTGLYPKPGEIFYPDTPQMRIAGLAGADVYPNGWQGKRFDKPIWMWAASVSGEATRDNPQRYLVGDPALAENWGTGTIPANLMTRGDGSWDVDRGSQPQHALDAVRVKHISGGTSLCQFKSYSQGREKWQGPSIDLVWLDEECPLDIYMEALTRTNATNGVVLMTFTPLRGLSEVVRLFIHSESELEKA